MERLRISILAMLVMTITSVFAANNLSEKIAYGAMAGCWQDRFAYGGATTLMFQRADAMDITASTEHFLQVRSLSLYTDVLINPYMDFHLMLNQHTTLTNNLPTSAEELGDEMVIDEAYVVIHDIAQIPIYIKAGKSYTIFGTYYDPYPPVLSINKGYVTANNTHITLGLATDTGYTLSAFVFENEATEDWNAYGMRFGYVKDTSGLDFTFNASYVDNYAALTGTMSAYPTSNANIEQAAYDLYAGVTVQDIKIWLAYFATHGTVLNTGNTKNAAPKVFSVNTRYDFQVMDKKASIRASYEKVADAAAIASYAFTAAQSPEKHLSLGVVIAIDKHTYWSLDYHRFAPFDHTLNDQKQLVSTLKVAF